MSWMSWNFVRFKINFWIDAESFSFLSWKTKKFHSEKKYFFSAVSKHAKIIPKDGASRSNFQWRFWYSTCSKEIQRHYWRYRFWSFIYASEKNWVRKKCSVLKKLRIWSSMYTCQKWIRFLSASLKENVLSFWML